LKKRAKNIARKYARALFELYELPALEELRGSLFEFAQLWEGNAQFRAALENPAISLTERGQVLRAVSEKLRPSDTTFANFFEVLLKNKRLAEIQSIAEALALIVEEVKRILSLKITSAFEVPAAERDGIGQRVQSEYGAMAAIEWLVDRDLIGGMTIKSGDKLLDASLKGALERMRTELLN
jgi:F-type H+-transporting ATPase subunit delta